MRVFFRIFIAGVLILRISFYYFTKPVFPDGTKIRITDSLASEPIRYSNSQYIKLSGFKIYLPAFPETSYGDNLVVEGIVKDSKLEDVKLVELRANTGLLVSLRKRLLKFYQRSLPEDHSALMSGITIGSKTNISTEFWERLKYTGTAHVVVASGMNVTLVASFLMVFLALFMPRGKAIFAALVGIWIYAFVSGFDAPIIRASVMGSLVFAAQRLGRVSYAWRNLFLSGYLMLFINPSWLFDLGFILSFVATSSLVLFEAKIYRLIYFVPGIFREGLSTSLAAQIGVGPILYYTFGRLNLLSPLVNASVLWTIAPLSLIGMLGGLLGVFFEPLGRIFMFLAYPLTVWFIWVVGLFS